MPNSCSDVAVLAGAACVKLMLRGRHPVPRNSRSMRNITPTARSVAWRIVPGRSLRIWSRITTSGPASSTHIPSASFCSPM
ncbi:hypothetical protein D3C86_1247090 [compost metagenome]